MEAYVQRVVVVLTQPVKQDTVQRFQNTQVTVLYWSSLSFLVLRVLMLTELCTNLLRLNTETSTYNENSLKLTTSTGLVLNL